MSKLGRIIVCSFTSCDDIKGLQGTRKLHGAAAERVYDQLKQVVLQAGRFSVFEATQSARAAHMFERLCKDPDLEIVKMGYPWTGIRLRDLKPEKGPDDAAQP